MQYSERGGTTAALVLPQSSPELPIFPQRIAVITHCSEGSQPPHNPLASVLRHCRRFVASADLDPAGANNIRVYQWEKSFRIWRNRTTAGGAAENSRRSGIFGGGCEDTQAGRYRSGLFPRRARAFHSVRSVADPGGGGKGPVPSHLSLHHRFSHPVLRYRTCRSNPGVSGERISRSRGRTAKGYGSTWAVSFSWRFTSS